MATIAEEIAVQFSSGEEYRSALGARLEELCDARGLRGVDLQRNVVRWDFPDDSSIVSVGGVAWDLGIPGSSERCCCWQGALGGRHEASCSDVKRGLELEAEGTVRP